MFLDDSACNLASINLMKFVERRRRVRRRRRSRRACRTLITAQEILVDNASYPTPGDRAEQPRLPAARPRLRQPRRAADVARPALRQRRRPRLRGGDHRGDERRGLRAVGADRARPRRPVRRLREEPRAVPARDAQAPRRGQATSTRRNVPADLYDARQGSRGTRRSSSASSIGYRNAQATVLAPTGTIGFMMDCDTTGVEPDIALVKYKKLVGGGLMKIVNQTVPMALREARLHRGRRSRRSSHYIDEHETIEGAPTSRTSTCRCSTARSSRRNGERSIHYMGHIKMMGATQPFISGAISKTVNVPKDATVEEIEQAYLESWRLGAKAIVDLPRRQQAHAAAQHVEGQDADAQRPSGRRRPSQLVSRDAGAPQAARRAPRDHAQVRHRRPRGLHHRRPLRGRPPGEIFLVMAKEGSTISGFADAFAQAISYALQYGVPLQALVDKFSHVALRAVGHDARTRRSASRSRSSTTSSAGWRRSSCRRKRSSAPASTCARSRRRRRRPAASSTAAAAGGVGAGAAGAVDAAPKSSFAAMQNQEDAPPCSTCGSIMIRSGAATSARTAARPPAARRDAPLDRCRATSGEATRDYTISVSHRRARLAQTFGPFSRLRSQTSRNILYCFSRGPPQRSVPLAANPVVAASESPYRR